MDSRGLPGSELIDRGLSDLQAGRETVESLLVLVGATRLRSLGLEVPPSDIDHPEHRLYELLSQEDADSAHSRYNALIRLLVSFERAAECVSS
jgi:hypothetical protein